MFALRTVLAASLAVAAAPAFASGLPGTGPGADLLRTEVVCRDARPLADAGYYLVIRTGGIVQHSVAELSEQSFMGPRLLSQTFVRREDRGLVRSYRGKDFELDIVRERLPGSGARGLHANLVAEVNGERIEQALRCTISVLKDPGGFTCMAYWTGFVFNAETGACAQIGASGCSNPFEFTTREACEAANLR